jgi:hypothetical protein
MIMYSLELDSKKGLLYNLSLMKAYYGVGLGLLGLVTL